MSESERRNRTIYHACVHAAGVVKAEQEKARAKPFKAALDMERQSYVDLANEIAADLGLEPLT